MPRARKLLPFLFLVLLGACGKDSLPRTQDAKGNIVQHSFSQAQCPYRLVSWNIQDFGRSKSHEALLVMAKVLKNADIVAIQEVVPGKSFGTQAVAKLANELNTTGSR